MRILSFSSWLYARCLSELLDHVRSSLSQSRPPPACLAVAGNCFHAHADYECLFARFDRSARSDPIEPQYWLRAWRNVARFRHDALDTAIITVDVQARLMNAYLDIFENAPPSFSAQTAYLHCCYLAPHVLKRRRFDPEFLDPESGLGRRFAAGLKRAVETAPSKRLRASVACALEFLQHKADATTLQELAKV